MKKGQKATIETRNKMSIAQKDRIVSTQTRKRISESLRGKIGRNTGHHHTIETKQKISEAKKGFKHTEETKKKMRGENSGRWKGGVCKMLGYNSFRSRHRRIQKITNGGSHSFSDWQTLKAQYNWTCPACKKSEPEIKLTEDHIIPLIKGGSDNIENIQPLCMPCNHKKYTQIIRYE